MRCGDKPAVAVTKATGNQSLSSVLSTPCLRMQWSGISLFCWALLGWTSCYCARSEVVVERNVCENITISMCKGLPYNCTKMPNMLNHQTQDEAGRELSTFFPLVDFNCYSYLKLFLCSVYLPRYTLDPAGTPPCRSVCQGAQQGCERLMNSGGHQWPPSLACTRFPRMGERPCLDENGRVIRKYTGTRPPVCEPMKIQMCKTNGQNETSVPNYLGHTSQDQAIRHMQQFQPLLSNMSCSVNLKPFLCSIYQPRCSPGGSSVSVPPCRSLCRKAQQSCLPFMKHGVSWPLKCGRFPKPSQRACTKVGSNVEPSVTTPPQTTNPPTCEPITITMCRDIGYNLTKMPNLLGLKTQSNLRLIDFSFLTNTTCSPYVKLFVCSLVTPKCDNGIVRKPCRSLCDHVKRGCQKLWRNWIGSRLLNCVTFPTPSMEACLAEDGTVRNHEQARYSGTVQSAVFPVTLKCQFPGNYFTIQKIIVVDGNGKKKKIRNKKKEDAKQQCQRTRRQVQDGYECDLTDPGQLGISPGTVITSVSVTYKCWKETR